MVPNHQPVIKQQFLVDLPNISPTHPKRHGTAISSSFAPFGVSRDFAAGSEAVPQAEL